jgi:hypothetical protein
MDPKDLRHLGIDANNETWTYFQNRELTARERDEMIAAAYASHYLWQKSYASSEEPSPGPFPGGGEKILKAARGHWLISRAMCVAAAQDLSFAGYDRPAVYGPLAEHHAFECTEHTRTATDAEDFDHVYAAEAEARSAALNGHAARARELRATALAMAEKLEDAESRELAVSDVKSEPWFGVIV